MPAKVGSTIEIKYSKNVFSNSVLTQWIPTQSDSILFQPLDGQAGYFNTDAIAGDPNLLRSSSITFPSATFGIRFSEGAIRLSYITSDQMKEFLFYAAYYPSIFFRSSAPNPFYGRDNVNVPSARGFTDEVLQYIKIQDFVGHPVSIWFQYQSKLGLSHVNFARITAWVRGLSEDKQSIALCEENGHDLEMLHDQEGNSTGVLPNHIVDWYQSDGKQDDPPVWTGDGRNQFKNSVDVLGAGVPQTHINFFTAFNGFVFSNAVNSYADWKDPTKNGDDITYPNRFSAIDIYGQTSSYNPNRFLTYPDRIDTTGFKQSNFSFGPEADRMLLHEPQPNSGLNYSDFQDTFMAQVVSSVVQPQILDDSTGQVLSRSVHRLVLRIADRTEIGLAELPINLSTPVRPQIRIGRAKYSMTEIIENDDETLVITMESV